MDDRNYYAEYLEMQPQLEGEWNEADEWMGLYGTINPYAQPVAKYEPLIDYSADSGDFDTASRITPDPAGDDVTAEPVTGFMRPCERCNGTGTIDRGGTSPWRIVHCPDCGGTGIYDEVHIAARDEREYNAYMKELAQMLDESLDYDEAYPPDRC